MTRGLDSNIASLLESGLIQWALLVEGQFEDSLGNDETVRLWTGVGTLPHGGNTYYGAGGALGFDGLEEITDVQSRGMTIRLDGVGAATVNSQGDTILDLAYRTEYQNRACSVSIGFFDPATRALVADPVTWFTGFMDVMTPVEDGDTVAIEMTVENFMVLLERPVPRTYTPEDQRELYPGDTFLDYVAELQNLEIELE